MSRAPDARLASRSPRVRRAFALAIVGWAMFAAACATTRAPSAETGATLYGTPRHTESLGFVAPPLPVANAPEAAPILDDTPAEPSSLYIAREILADRADDLDELQREGVARAIVKAEQEHGLPALLVLALIEQESHFHPTARGPHGSLGLMQLMPTSARELAARHDIPWQGTRSLHDPVTNVRLGILYLVEMRAAFEDTELAMAAYNIGPGAVQDRIEKGLSCKGPYVKGVLQRYQSLRLIFGDPTTAIGG